MNQRELLIDRMVDGELTLDQQRELLLSCEEQNSWRELALAYAESQAIGEVIRQKAEGETSHSRQVMTSQDRATAGRGSNGLSLAAAVLLSLGLGYGLGWIWPSEPVSNNMIADAQPSLDKSEQLGSGPADQGDDKVRSMHFMVSDPISDELQQIELPVVYASELGPNWQQQIAEELPEEMLRNLRASGINVRQTRTMTRVRLPDGRRIIVPIDYFFEQSYQ